MARNRFQFCNSLSHAVNRRQFLGALSTGLLAGPTLRADNVIVESPQAADLKKQRKAVIILYLGGGASQLETWDPKPGAPTGGPYRAIPTSVPGLHISELMPKMAARLKHTCILRGLNTRNADHGGGSLLMMRGRRDEPNLKYPDLGAVL